MGSKLGDISVTGWNERIGTRSQIFGQGVALLALAVILSWQFVVHNTPVIEPAAPERLAEVLFTSQASVGAIVFSLTYVGVQLTSPQYSPRLTWLFTENSHLRWTLATVGVSLSLDATVLVGSNLIPATLRLATAISMAILAGITFIAIGEYAMRSLTLATPAGVISAYDSRILADNYHQEVKNTRQSRRVDENPLRGLYEFLISQIDDGAGSTWASGIDVITTKIGEITNAILEKQIGAPTTTQTVDRSQIAQLPLVGETDLDQSEGIKQQEIECNSELVDLSSDAAPTAEELFSPPLVEFLPSLSQKADARGASEEARACLKKLRETHERGLKYGSKELLAFSHEGIRTVLTPDSGDSVSDELALTSWYFALIELRETARIQSNSHYRHLAKEIESYRQLLETEEMAPFFTNTPVFNSAVLTASRIQARTIEAAGSEFETEIRDLWKIDLPTHTAHVAVTVAIFRLLCSLTELAVTAAQDDVSPVPHTFLRHQWKQIAQSACQQDAGLGVTFSRGLIETAFVVSVVVDSDESRDQVESWASTIEELHETAAGPVEEAFDRVYPEGGTRRRRRATVPQPLLRLAEFKPIREHPDASTIIPKLDPRTDVQERPRRQ